MRPRFRGLIRFLVILLLLLILWFARSVWLPWFGTHLVRAGSPEKVDMIVVLAGDSGGNRILKAAELVKGGYAPAALVSGPGGMYDRHECDFEIEFAEHRGYPRSLFIPLPLNDLSTRTEAITVVRELRKRGVKRFIVVTSDTHTRRAGNIYRSLAPDLEVLMVAAPSRLFAPAAWWQEREGQKAILEEWLKTVANWISL